MTVLALCKAEFSLKRKDAFRLQISFHLNRSSGYLGEKLSLANVWEWAGSGSVPIQTDCPWGCSRIIAK